MITAELDGRNIVYQDKIWRWADNNSICNVEAKQELKELGLMLTATTIEDTERLKSIVARLVAMTQEN